MSAAPLSSMRLYLSLHRGALPLQLSACGLQAYIAFPWISRSCRPYIIRNGNSLFKCGNYVLPLQSDCDKESEQKRRSLSGFVIEERDEVVEVFNVIANSAE